ncbi:MAG: GTP-binding protein [Myxococcales bacterium]|nr:GTP-binding protein [Myxococcales bacterium]
MPMTVRSRDRNVGVTIISGFLGAGKTTLLRRLVCDERFGPRLAILVNDVGELGLDPELIRSAGSAPTLRITELVSGCICCTLQGEFVTALRTLIRGEGLPRKPEHILIEPSGIARASELSFAINAIGSEEPVETDAVITLVDAHNAARAFSEQPDLFVDQVRSADLILINKADLMPDPAERERLLEWLRPLAPRANLLWTAQAQIDPALLFGQIDLLAQAVAPAAQPSTKPAIALHHRHESSQPRHESDHAMHAAPQEGMAALTLPVPFVVDRDRLEDFLDAQADRIFRIKGIVSARWARPADEAATEAPVPTLVQAVGDRVDIDRLHQDSPLCSAPRRLIFIGSPSALDRARLTQELWDTAEAAGSC